MKVRESTVRFFWFKNSLGSLGVTEMPNKKNILHNNNITLVTALTIYTSKYIIAHRFPLI